MSVRKKFFAESVKEHCRPLLNPDRGWYEIYNFNIEDTPDFEELQWCIRDWQTIALLRFHLKAVRSSALSEQQLIHMDEIFSFFKNAGKHMILRFTYDVEGEGLKNEPSDIRLILYHIAQIGKVIKKYEKYIFVVQGLFIGSWGEMHHTSYGSKACICQLASAVRAAIGNNIFMAVRKPVQLRYLKGMDIDKVGLFNDGLFGSETHLGTFGDMGAGKSAWEEPWCSDEETSFVRKVCDQVADGGEAVFGGEMMGFEQLNDTLSQLRITYLNGVYDERILNIWKERTIEQSGVWQGKSWYEYIGAHMGYRILLMEIKARIGFTKIQFKFTIQNTGYAPLFTSANLYVCRENYILGQAELPNPLLNDRTYDICVRTPVFAGEVDVLLKTGDSNGKNMDSAGKIEGGDEILWACESGITGHSGLHIGCIR